jgi:hypothetical protein
MAHTNPPERDSSGKPTETHVQPGGDVHGHGVREASAAVHHEVTDIPLGGVTRAAGITIVFVGLVMLLMWGAWGFFLSQARQADPGKPAMAADDYGQRLPSTPRLQSTPQSDLAIYRTEQTAKLNGLAWVDQSAGTVRMPINAAMQLIVARADAFADQRAKTPPDHSWAFPGAAMTERASEPPAPALPEHSPSPVPSRGTEERPQPHSTAPSEQDKPQPPQH